MWVDGWVILFQTALERDDGFYNRGAVASGAALRGGFLFSCFVSLSFRFVFVLCGSTSLSLFAYAAFTIAVTIAVIIAVTIAVVVIIVHSLELFGDVHVRSV